MSALLNYDSDKFNSYIVKLRTMASFSRLFSESDSPYIHYRVTENLYTQCLGAINVSRADCTADALYGKTGVGIKTFVNESYQKIAEFNGLRPQYAHLHGLDLATAISKYRNARIDVTMRSYGLNNMIYHYIVREPGKIKLFECQMHRVDLNHIRILEDTDKKIVFTDGLEEYEFIYSKSTLYKRFDLSNPFFTCDVQIISDPIDALVGYLGEMNLASPNDEFFTIPVQPNQLIIPLYVEDRRGNRSVKEKSGLNIWNAAGRPRDPNEVYIPFPVKIRREHPEFFPHRDIKWDLQLPNGNHLSMKLCQQGEKAIMSKPNKALGKWLLRDVLNLKENQVLTYEYLLEVGIDSVIFTKIDEGKYKVDFIAFDE